MRPFKVGVAAAALVVLLLMPAVRDIVDTLGAGKDSADTTVSTLIEWLLAAACAVLIYSAIVAVPGVVARLRATRR